MEIHTFSRETIKRFNQYIFTCFIHFCVFKFSIKRLLFDNYEKSNKIMFYIASGSNHITFFRVSQIFTAKYLCMLLKRNFYAVSVGDLSPCRRFERKFYFKRGRRGKEKTEGKINEVFYYTMLDGNMSAFSLTRYFTDYDVTRKIGI